MAVDECRDKTRIMNSAWSLPANAWGKQHSKLGVFEGQDKFKTDNLVPVERLKDDLSLQMIQVVQETRSGIMHSLSFFSR
jgi:hypothetical protein